MLDFKFFVAGRAVFTVTVPDWFREKHRDCKPHYTFRVKHYKASYGDRWDSAQRKMVRYEKWPESLRGELLTGPDNTTNYTYLGLVAADTGAITSTQKSKHLEKSWPFRILARVLAVHKAGSQGKIQEHEFDCKHAGHCAKCGRELTHPESLLTGFGPECIKHV